MSNAIAQIKRSIGAFFRKRRESIGWSLNQLRERTNTSGLQLDKLESGTDSVNTETLFRVMLELGIGLHLTEQNSDEATAHILDGTISPPAFLLCADEKSRQLYVLHWQGPAFLVQVIQTVPHQLRVVATYGRFTQDQLRQLPVWGELESFVRKAMSKAVPGN
jgi:transcriptional regulator with XRE-family HTH domain